MKDAQIAYKFKASDYSAVRSTSLLKWYAIPASKKAKCKSRLVYPCLVCPDVAEAMAGHEDTVQLTARNNTLIRYLGYRISYRDKIQAVPSTHLLDFNHGSTAEEGASSGSVVNASPLAGTTLPSKEEKDTLWSPNFMSVFLNSLCSQQEFKVCNDDDRNLKIKTEEKFLQLILESVLQHEQHPQPTSNMDGCTDDDSNSVSTIASEYDADNPQNATSPQPSGLWQSPKAPDSKEELTATVKSKVTDQNIKERSYASRKNSINKLRAGDVIEYWYVNVCFVV
jgi:hypothetical protein